MEVELLSVGAELLLGFTVDRNAAHIAQVLAPHGIRVARRATVTDDPQEIARAMEDALARTGTLIVTGGLGPTADDVTRDAAAMVAGAPLELDPTVLEQIQDRFTRLGRGPMPETNRVQAMVPRGATVLPNERGTAPGLWIETPRGVLVLLPGVPGEMQALLAGAVLPLLRRRAPAEAVVRSRTVRTTGLPESDLAARLEGVTSAMVGASLAFLPGLEGVDLRVTAGPGAPEAVDLALAQVVDALRTTLGARCYGEGDADLAAVVLGELRRRRMRLAVAESCTGGLIGARLTAVEGASDVFVGGVISYADDSKVRDLSVPPDVLDTSGAVSEAVVAAMVQGARDRFGADAGIAVSGIAGPAGGTEAKPVGTVCLAAGAGPLLRTVTRRFPGGREDIRARAAQAALDLLRAVLAEAEPLLS